MVSCILTQRIFLERYIFQVGNGQFVVIRFIIGITNLVLHAVLNILPAFGVFVKVRYGIFKIVLLKVSVAYQQFDLIGVLRFWFLRQYFFAVGNYFLQVIFFVQDLG